MGNPAANSMSGVRTTTLRVFVFWPFGSRISASERAGNKLPI